ncbi:patatin-like phospholipase family protein [Myroides sp. 1354]|uniref:patatin-like phospholipase family protein n=1 Tax=unclassified Myroides TaxID=2642485 RepID=UPI0025756088|nr:MULTISPECIES: patatin-like phospholipase family protein [unclassified Myroides]MDM1043537.1 patatin-like phospholipase family protein [Myroides sp. R163-1]MDM1054413.1 patatin-like phospholipase family protein [Myroides sp. 1354]MDM1067709.1 patatin-like phospholipase family protein [Myroides sp. 1372]
MRRIIALLAIVLAAGTSFAQEEDRPKVGVVLSGGGAKGLAHIGVLKVLEEQGVQVDYITGTSMGAIVGGLYASGYTASELDSIFSSIDATALIRDYIPRISKSFYEKKNDEIYALTLPFDKFKIGLPKAFSRGMYNYNLMNRLLAHVRHVRDFNDLNIPFLCIATNIETGKPVLIDSGYLPQAILASGAFPSLFAPVLIDDKHLIDGGIVNNYPIEELKALGADIVIGVDVQDGLKGIDDINGAADVLLQISNYSTINQMKNKIGETDIYIKPDISGYTVVSFEEGKAIIQRGVEAAETQLDAIKKIGGKKDVLQKQFVPKYTDKIHVNSIDIKGLTRYTRRYVHGKLGFKPDSWVSFNDLEKGIDQLNGTDNFSSISYRFDANGDGDELVLDLVENPTKRYLKLGVHYDGLYKSAALVNVTQKNLLMKSDIASLDVAVGDNVRYNFNYFVDNGFYWSVGINSKYNQFSHDLRFKMLLKNDHFDLPSDIDLNSLPAKFNVDYKDVENRLVFQTFYQQKFLLAVGLEHRYFDIKSNTLNVKESNFDRSTYLGGFANFTFDTYDNKYFPRKGFMFKGEYKNYFYSSDYLNNFQNFSMITGNVGYATRLADKLFVDLRSRMGATIGNTPSMGFMYFLGGYGFADRDNIIPFYGYDLLSIAGNSYITGSLNLDYEIFKKHHINFSANFANVGEDIFSGSEWLFKSNYTGYAIGYGMQTMIGPIEVKYSYSPETGGSYTYFSVGFWF